jgi:hypothetical protein
VTPTAAEQGPDDSGTTVARLLNPQSSSRQLQPHLSGPAACELMGWRYDVVDTPPAALLNNVRWLARYRHPRHVLLDGTACCARSSANRAS